MDRRGGPRPGRPSTLVLLRTAARTVFAARSTEPSGSTTAPHCSGQDKSYLSRHPFAPAIGTSFLPDAGALSVLVLERLAAGSYARGVPSGSSRIVRPGQPIWIEMALLLRCACELGAFVVRVDRVSAVALPIPPGAVSSRVLRYASAVKAPSQSRIGDCTRV